VNSIAKLIWMLVAFGLALAWVNHGPGGPTRWLKAKFLGRP
jgi:hypothetical protein